MWGEHPMAVKNFPRIVVSMTAKFISDLNDSGCELCPDQPNSQPRILVVEDDCDLRQLTAEVLVDGGYAVDVAVDGAAAWSALQISQYDLVVTDQFLPKLSGVELLKKIHTAGMTLPVIMGTRFLPTWEFALHTWLRPVKMLFKPYSSQKLLGMVKTVLNETAGAHAGIAARPG
jgi:DNA-binding response OmpR family regulator